MNLKFKRIHSEAKLPTYATDGSACFDFRALDMGYVLEGDANAFRTGLSAEVPEGYALLIFSRSGHGFNSGLRLSNCVGVIDSDYRGEIKVSLHNDGGSGFRVNAGDRIAQGMLVASPRVNIVEVDELSHTERGVGGFGSTGR